MWLRKSVKIILIVMITLAFGIDSYGQDLLKAKDLSQLKVDLLTDADVAKLKAQMSGSGMTIDQAEQVALSRGMPAAEVAKLRQRLTAPASNLSKEALKDGKTAMPLPSRTSSSADSLDVYDKVETTKPLINPLIFGSELYTRVAPSFEPNLNLATPMNYILGPGDQLQVSVYGVQLYEGELTVSADGYVSIPSVGQVKVAGLTIEAVTQKLKVLMGNTVYPYLKSGGSKLSVTLGRIRSIRVTVIGSNHPGNFTVSSLSTVFNVLYLAGGPSTFGSFREIELLRDNKVIAHIDLYRLLLRGDQSDNIGLKDNDVIRIPPYKSRVELQGQVKRPGIFEVLPSENFIDVLDFASGLTDTAYKASVKVFRRGEKERVIFDLANDQFNTYKPQSGDLFVFSKMLNRFQNRVTINGAVMRPDVYELSPGLRAADLIRKADGLKEDAYTGRAQITRSQEDLTKAILSFDVRKALAGDPENNPLLVKEDELLVSSVLDIRDSFKIKIQGEIRKPGIYDYVENLTLKDLILQAGGVTDAAFNNIEIARLIKRDTVDVLDVRASNIIRTSISVDMSVQSANVPLQPFDVVTIRRKAGYILPESVTITGQVQYPGPYVLSTRTERVSDIIKRAGGLTPNAYPAGAYLKRFKTEQEKKKSELVVRKVQGNVKDSTSGIVEEITRDFDQIPLDMEVIAREPGSIDDIILKANDELFIPKFDAQVKINGAVLLATQVPYQKSYNLKDYVNEAGGYSGDAWHQKSYVVYANGKAATTKHFLFFKFYPKIEPGSELIVPLRPVSKRTSITEIIGISSGIASLAGIVIALLRL
jgi:protein involved in polysaccharide export with SLBB domain